MKKKLIRIAASCFLFAGLTGAQGHEAPAGDTPASRVTVFEVPLGCPAAPAIGCGSAAKPILLQLERDSSVSEAWLNRTGTKLAVVWKAEPTRKDRRRVASALKEEKATEVKGGPRQEALAEFLSGNGWYRGADVDKLSEEEAGIIATRWVQRVQAKTTLTGEKAEGLRNALTEGLKKCLTGKVAMPETPEDAERQLQRIATPFLNEKQMEILKEAAGCGMRAMPDEK